MKNKLSVIAAVIAIFGSLPFGAIADQSGSGGPGNSDETLGDPNPPLPDGYIFADMKDMNTCQTIRSLAIASGIATDFVDISLVDRSKESGCVAQGYAAAWPTVVHPGKLIIGSENVVLPSCQSVLHSLVGYDFDSGSVSKINWIHILGMNMTYGSGGITYALPKYSTSIAGYCQAVDGQPGRYHIVLDTTQTQKTSGNSAAVRAHMKSMDDCEKVREAMIDSGMNVPISRCGSGASDSDSYPIPDAILAEIILNSSKKNYAFNAKNSIPKAQCEAVASLFPLRALRTYKDDKKPAYSESLSARCQDTDFGGDLLQVNVSESSSD